MLRETKCSGCGAPIPLNEERTVHFCQYCGTPVKADEADYEFEKFKLQHAEKVRQNKQKHEEEVRRQKQKEQAAKERRDIKAIIIGTVVMVFAVILMNLFFLIISLIR